MNWKVLFLEKTIDQSIIDVSEQLFGEFDQDQTEGKTHTWSSSPCSCRDPAGERGEAPPPAGEF